MELLCLFVQLQRHALEPCGRQLSSCSRYTDGRPIPSPIAPALLHRVSCCAASAGAVAGYVSSPDSPARFPSDSAPSSSLAGKRSGSVNRRLPSGSAAGLRTAPATRSTSSWPADWLRRTSTMPPQLADDLVLSPFQRNKPVTRIWSNPSGRSPYRTGSGYYRVFSISCSANTISYRTGSPSLSGSTDDWSAPSDTTCGPGDIGLPWTVFDGKGAGNRACARPRPRPTLLMPECGGLLEHLSNGLLASFGAPG